jgi:hypothetical protein
MRRIAIITLLSVAGLAQQPKPVIPFPDGSALYAVHGGDEGEEVQRCPDGQVPHFSSCEPRVVHYKVRPRPVVKITNRSDKSITITVDCPRGWIVDTFPLYDDLFPETKREWIAIARKMICRTETHREMSDARMMGQGNLIEGVQVLIDAGIPVK